MKRILKSFLEFKLERMCSFQTGFFKVGSSEIHKLDGRVSTYICEKPLTWFQEIVTITSTIYKTTSPPELTEETETNFVQWEISVSSPKLYYSKSVGNTILSASFAIIFLWMCKKYEFRSIINRNSFQNNACSVVLSAISCIIFAAFTLLRDHMNDSYELILSL